MKHQDFFSLKNDKKKNLDCRLLQILLGALRVKMLFRWFQVQADSNFSQRLPLETVSKVVNLSFSALWACSADDKLIIFLIIQRKKTKETICVKDQSLFSGKSKKNVCKCFLLNFLPSMLSINRWRSQMKLFLCAPWKYLEKFFLVSKIFPSIAAKIGTRPWWLSWMRVRLVVRRLRV